MGLTIGGSSQVHRSVAKPAQKLTYDQWKKAIAKEFSVAGPWAPSGKNATEVKRHDLPARLQKVYDECRKEGEGTVNVWRKTVDGRSAYMFQWPCPDQGVFVSIRDANNKVIEPYRDRKAEAQMDTNYALQAAKDDHFESQRPKSANPTVDHWLRMYQAVADEAGNAEYLDAPDTWKATPAKLAKLSPAAATAYAKAKADAAYVNPENGSILLEKLTITKDFDRVRTYQVLDKAGKLLQSVRIKSEM